MAGLLIGAVTTLFIVGLAVAALASRTREPVVEVAPLVARVLAELPGQNCSACGNANCLAAAESISAGSAPADTCLAGGEEVAARVDAVLRSERDAPSR